ncbi:MAG TPA: Na+/H+ antiporter subunit E [Mesorhizobium sp.]|jgi:multicomponent Na+:H+ antiporter subunit E|nr:Na+/H+ antiporter subunit E [Mesorhizobium sp.]
MSGKLLAASFFALAWVVFGGGPTFGNLLFGGLLGLAVALLVPSPGRRSAGSEFRLLPALRLLLRFPLDIWLSGWRVAKLVLSPAMPVRPALLELPLRLEGEGRIALLANMITLTPGTLTVDVLGEADKRLLIHALDAPDVEAAKAEIRDGFERMILDAWGRGGPSP